MDFATVRLERVSEANLEAVLELQVRDDQRAFLDTPDLAEFLADAPQHPTFAAFSLCVGPKVVGFVSVGHRPGDPRNAWIPLLIIAREFQGQGYGRAAMNAVLELIREDLCDYLSVGLAYKPANLVAERLYLGLGFAPTGNVDDRGEVELRMSLQRP